MVSLSDKHVRCQPGKYGALFSAVRASTYPVLELATDILEHLAKYQPARERMVGRGLESTCERLIRDHDEQVRKHATKALWRLRDHDAILLTLQSVVTGNPSPSGTFRA